MRIAICTDAWHPQINGVVRSLCMTVDQLLACGHEVELITPQQFRTVPMPGYREIRLAMMPRSGVQHSLDHFAPDIVHIATEGLIGWSARAWCKRRGIPFTTAFHTHFPDYLAVRTRLPADWFWPAMRRFHAPAQAVLVSTPTLGRELTKRGLPHWQLWSRGIDQGQFHTGHAPLAELAGKPLHTLPRPLLLYVGRVSPEKNLSAFLDAPVAGTRIVVGDGPDLARLRSQYPDVVFTGALSGEQLARAYCTADLFVFPSRTDTFGLVMIEALACGLPVAALPVPGPLDIIGPDGRGPDGALAEPVGALDHDLATAIARALPLSRIAAADYGRSFSWSRATEQFLAALTAARCERIHETAIQS